jgi:Outer membrane protein (OmpH-like).
MQQQRRKLMQPLLKKLQAAIDKIAAQQELEAVMRKQVLLYDDQTSGGVVDITRDVASELGVSLTQSPGEPAPTLNQNQQPPGNQDTPPGGGGGQ